MIPGELAGNEADVHNTGEHVPPDKLTASGACSTDRFHIRGIRVCSPQEVLRTAYGGGTSGKHKLCKHVLTDWLTFSSACISFRLHHPIIRV